MIINSYDAAALSQVFGIDAAGIGGLGIGTTWARVRAGGRSEPHQHDESEVFVILSGSGDIVADGRRQPVTAGTVVGFAPFETHVIENPGPDDLVFLSVAWRDSPRATQEAHRKSRQRFDGRPVFVYSTPPTPNGDLHLGHLSGPYIGADVFVRFQRMNGVEAWHITGSDDHQSYVADRARREGREPAQTAAHFSQAIAATLALMDITPDQFTSTSSTADYPRRVQDFFSRITAARSVTRQRRPAFFDPATGDYVFEVSVTGGCPSCGGGTSGGICEECGKPNAGVDLTDPRLAGSGDQPRIGSVVGWSVPLHEYGELIDRLYRQHRTPARIRELAGRVFNGDRLDVALTHPVPWGVRSPDGEDGGQALWAILDVAYSLLYGIESLGRRLGRGWRADDPQSDWKIVQFFGYDNTFYNAIVVPILYGLAYPGWTPDMDFNVNEFYELNGAKFSTSRDNVIRGKDVLGPDNVDAIRLFLSLTRPELHTSGFDQGTYEEFVSRALVGGWQGWLNDLGDRIKQHYGGQAPDAGIWTPQQSAFLARLDARLSALTVALGPDGFSLNHAATQLLGLADDAVRFARSERPVADSASWRDENRTAIALELAAARLLAAGAAPVMPQFSRRLSEAIGIPGPHSWPHEVALVPPGTPVDLASHSFFGAAA